MMGGPPGGASARFEIDASVVLQLGRELINDDAQAVLELAKNAYDADSGYAVVTVDTTYEAPRDHPYWPGARGRVKVEDGGHGMDEEALRSGWLTIGRSAKRDLKARGGTTPGGRTPLGDKGLGRLAAQRLGDHLQIITRPAGRTEELSVSVSWRRFVTGTNLSDVPVSIEQRTRDQSSSDGTAVTIEGLRDPEAWRGQQRETLKGRLSTLLAPYREIRKFTVVVEVDCIRQELADITDQIRRGATLSYRFSYAAGVLNIAGKAKLNSFSGQSKRSRPDDRNDHERYVVADNGVALREHLCTRLKSCAVRPCATDGWYLEYEHHLPLRDLGGVALDDCGAPADPGPFDGEIDAVSLDPEEQEVFGSGSQYRQLVRELAGIRVYREGFGIALPQDWLGLGKQWTSGTSYFGLRPANTIGYVALSARDNASLREATDREGFVDTPHYRNFRRLLEQVTRFASRMQGRMRREYAVFIQQQHESRSTAVAPSAADRSPQASIARVRQAVEQASQTVRALEASVATVHQTGGPSAGASVAALLDLLRETAEGVRVLDLQVRQIVGQMEQLYEVAGLGLTAEAVSHEINIVADALAERARQAIKSTRAGTCPDKLVRAFATYVQSSTSALRIQLAHLTPALKYLRERRETIELPAFILEWRRYHGDRLARKRITLRVVHSEHRPFRIRMNPGKLTQVMDNLILNSEYWICQASPAAGGSVEVELDSPHVRLRDSGPGVSPAVEDQLFEPFVTLKPPGEGRGLGLFIAQQLLDSEGCSVSLLQIRNDAGRRYVFDVDLGGSIHGGERAEKHGRDRPGIT